MRGLIGTIIGAGVLLVGLGVGLIYWPRPAKESKKPVAEKTGGGSPDAVPTGAAKEPEKPGPETKPPHKVEEPLPGEALKSVAAQVRIMRLRGERGAYFLGMPRLQAALARAREQNAPEDVIQAIRNEMGNLVTIGDVEITREWDDFPGGTDSVAFAPKLDRYARLQIGGPVTVREAGTGKELSRLPINGRTSGARFGPDGRMLSVHAVGGVLCFGVDEPQAARRWQVSGCSACVWAPDGKVALCAHRDKSTLVVDATSGKAIRRLPQGWLMGDQPVHPTRPWVALGNDKEIIAVNYQTGKEVGKAPVGRNGDTAVCWHPSAPVLAAADRIDLQIRLLDVTTGQEVIPPIRGLLHGGLTPTFDPTGKYVVTTEWSDIIRAWDASTGRLMLQTRMPLAGGVQFRPDGQGCCAIRGQKLQLFRIHPGEGLRVAAPPGGPASGFGLFTTEPSGRIVIVSRAGRINVLGAEDGRELGALPEKTILVGSVQGDGSLLTVSQRGLERWPVRVDEGVGRVGPPERPLTLPRYVTEGWSTSADGQVIAFPAYRDAIIWDRKRPSEVKRTAPQHDVRNVALSPDGQWIVTGSHGVGGVSVSNARTGKLVRRLIEDGGAAVFSPGGNWLAVWGSHGGTALFRTGTWESVRQIGNGAVAFSPDDRLVAVSEGFGVLRLVTTETGKEVSRLETVDQTSLTPLRFSPDGGRLYAVGNLNRALYIWDLRLIRARLKAMDADWDVPPLPEAKVAPSRPLEVRIDAVARPVVTALVGLESNDQRVFMQTLGRLEFTLSRGGAPAEELAKKLLAKQADYAKDKPARDLLDEIAARKKPVLAAALLLRVVRARRMVSQYKQGRVVVGQLEVKDGKTPAEMVMAQMPILEEGYFATEVATLDRPLTFRSHGSEPLDVPLKGKMGDVVLVGKVTLEALKQDRQAKLKGKVALDGSKTSESAKVQLRVMVGPVNTLTGGYSPRRSWPKPITVPVEKTGEFSAAGLSPGNYSLSVTAKDHADHSTVLTFTAGKELEAPPIRLSCSSIGHYVGKPPPKSKPLAWEKDYSSALKKARDEKKPMMVMMTATWCGYCKLLEKNTLDDPWIRHFLSSFVVVKAYEDKAVEAKYGQGGYPTLVFTDHEGKAAHRSVGYKLPQPFSAECANAYRKLGLKMPDELQTLVDKKAITPAK